MGRWDGVSSRHSGPPPPPLAPPPLLHLQHVDWGQTSINNLQVLRLLSRNLCRARRRLIEELLPGKSINAAEEQRRHKKLRSSFLLPNSIADLEPLPQKTSPGLVGGSSLAPPCGSVPNYGPQAQFGPAKQYKYMCYYPVKKAYCSFFSYLYFLVNAFKFGLNVYLTITPSK